MSDKAFEDWVKGLPAHACRFCRHVWQASQKETIDRVIGFIHEQKGYDQVENTMIIDAKELLDEIKKEFGGKDD